MATINLTIPDAVVPRVLAAFNGSQAAAKAALIDYLKTSVRNFEGDAARKAAFDDVDADIAIS